MPTGSAASVTPNSFAPGGVEPLSPASPYGGLDQGNIITPYSFAPPNGVQDPSASPYGSLGDFCKSKYPGNARAQVICNKDRTFDQIAPKVMSGLARKQGLFTDDAAGFVGNMGTESDGFTKTHELQGTRGNVHPAPPGKGGRGYGQWTFGRHIEFKKLIADRENKPYSKSEYPESDYSDFDNNMAMIQNELGGKYNYVVRDVMRAKSRVPPWATNMSVGGSVDKDVNNSTFRAMAGYETPQDYLDWRRNQNDPDAIAKLKTNFRSRVVWAKRAKEDYKLKLQGVDRKYFEGTGGG